jgi:arsenite methyltransferase
MADKIAVPAPVKADYGIDAPRQLRRMIWRGTASILLGVGLYMMNRADAPNGGLALFSALFCVGLGFLGAAGVMYWSSRTGKIQVRDQILEALEWRGDEKVLDVGCGRGLFLIGAAKRLNKTGKATGIDLWDTDDLSGNSAAAAMANAKVEGVASAVRVEDGDMRRLPYQPGSYDVVLSSLAVHNLHESGDREKAVLEMLRVLKPGGHLAVLDIFHTGDYLQIAERNGAEIVKKSGLSFLWCLPTRWFIARKKAF